MTVHKGLGIAIQKKSKCKSNGSLYQTEKDYTVTINVKILSELGLIGKMWMYYLLMNWQCWTTAIVKVHSV